MAYDCGKNCWGTSKCKLRRDCACGCGPLKSINPNLFQGCYDACAEPPRPTDPDDYMINFVGGQVMYNNYGMIIGGYNPHESAQYIAYEEQEEKKAEANEGSKSLMLFIQIALGIGIVIGVVWLLWPRRG